MNEHVLRSEQGRRGNNEDVISAFPAGETEVYVIADGMGGTSCGEVAASIAVNGIRDLIEKEQCSDDELMDPGRFRELMDTFFNRINKMILLDALTDDDKLGMGTTLTVLFVRGTQLLLAHIGDTRCYLLHGSSVTRLTEDHSVGNKLVRSLGVNEYITPAIYGYNIIYGDIVLLCSDGLYSLLDDRAIGRLADRHNDLNESMERLFEASYGKGSDDNMSGILVRIKPKGKGDNDK